jgi:hypothetical protein
MWGIGVEREMHFFAMGNHRRALPKVIGVFYPSGKNILVQLKDPARAPDLKRRFGITDEELALFQSSNIDPKLENSGKRCAGLLPPQANMIELVTTNYRRRTVASISRELERNSRLITSVVAKLVRDRGVRAQLKLGNTRGVEVGPHPYGAAIFEDPRRGGATKDYTGSWQFTLTLPHPPGISASAFIVLHEKFGNQLQWLEPLMAATLFTPDPSCVVEEGYAFAAYRTVRYGWGNFAGTDVSRLHKGVGRRANVEPAWRQTLTVRNKATLDGKRCMATQETKPSRNMDELSGKFGHVSSDFRTFGIEDGGRVSGAPMQPGFGFEYRIFDHFSHVHIGDVLSMLVHVAENSRQCKYRAMYVYKDADWTHAMQSVVRGGWRAELREGYVRKLCDVLELPEEQLKGLNTAEAVSLKVFRLLRDKTRDGPWVRMMLGARLAAKGFKIPRLNREAWGHFYTSVFNTRNRARIIAALNTMPVGKRFTAGDVRVDPPFLKSILPYALESEPGLRRQGGAYYVRTRDLLRPASSAAASCSDKQSECQIT